MKLTREELEHYAASERFLDAIAIPKGTPLTLSLLGQGEYNINYSFVHPVTGQRLVLRHNTKSQMHLEDQIGYEYDALVLLQRSGVTPRPYYVDRENGILVMEFLPGRALDYRTDLSTAAVCLARLHAVKPTQDGRLLAPTQPLQAMLEECQEMAQVFFQYEGTDRETKRHLCRLLEQAQHHMGSGEPMRRCIINTELNSGNFLINPPGEGSYIIDWEKPLLGEAAQDLGHFLAPTTTLWKTQTCLDTEQKQAFLRCYLAECERPMPPELLWQRTILYETMTCLRGVCWCAMAWVEYQDPHRPIRNEQTYQKICQYLSPDFLDRLARQYFSPRRLQ